MTATRLAIDTNLLVLLVVGQVAPTFIPRHRRLRAYSEADYALLTKILTGSDSVVATPNALSEVSNLVIYGVAEPLRSHFLMMLARIARSVCEVFAPSAQATGAPEVVRFGLTDTAWLEILAKEIVMLTDDRNLYLAAATRGLNVFYFRQVKEFGGMHV